MHFSVIVIDCLPPEFYLWVAGFFITYICIIDQLIVIHSSFVLLSLHIALKFEMIKKLLIFGYTHIKKLLYIACLSCG